jgi:hypothetical protein
MTRHETPLTGLRRKDRDTTVSSTPKGLDFIRSGIALAATGGNHAAAVKFAQNRWGAQSRAVIATKAAGDVPALSTIYGSEGNDFLAVVDANDSPTSDMVTAIRAEFVDLVRSSALIGRVPLRRVPFQTPFLVMDNGPVTAWRDEGQPYGSSMPPVRMTRQLPLERFDLGTMIVVTNELLKLQNVDVELWLRDQLVKALAEKLDSEFIDPSNTGTTGVKPAAITATAAALDDSPSEGIFEGFDKYTGDPERSVIVMNPWRAARAYSAARPDIGMRGGSLGGVPVYTTTACPEEVVVMFDPDSIAFASEGAEIRMSEHASVEMEQSPSNASAPSVAQANLTSMWQTGSVAVIGSVFASWRVLRAESVVYFNGPAIGL